MHQLSGRQHAAGHVLAALLVAVLGALLWSAHPAGAANTNVGVEADGTLTSCKAGSYFFAPESVKVAPGDTVTFNNPTAHTGTTCGTDSHPTACKDTGTSRGSTKGDCPFSNFELDPGESHVESFLAEGTFQLQCLRHPKMLLTVTVGDGNPDRPAPDSTTTAPDPDPPTRPPPDLDPTSEPSDPDPRPTTAGPDPTDPPSDAATGVTIDAGAPTPSEPAEPPPSDGASDPTAQSDVVVEADEPARGPLLVGATALLGVAIAGLTWARSQVT